MLSASANMPLGVELSKRRYTVGNASSESSVSEAPIPLHSGSPPMSPRNHPIESLLAAISEFGGLYSEPTIAQLEAFLMLLTMTGNEEKDIRQEDLGDKLKPRRSQGTIAKQLNKFVEAGILEKSISDESEREKTYKLTRDGKRLMDRIDTIMKG